MAPSGALLPDLIASAPAVVGHVLGGALAARFAIAHGARISRLVLIDTFGLSPFQPPPEFGRALTDYISQPSEATHESLWQQCAFDLASLRLRMGERWEPFADYNVGLALEPRVQAAARMLMEHFDPEIPRAQLARIAVPTTLVWGRHDRPLPLAIAVAAGERYGWPLHIIENSADDPPVEQPEALVRVLRALLDVSDRNSKGETHVQGR